MRLDHCDLTFLFIRKPSLNMCKSVVHSFERSPHPWLFTMIRFGCDMACQIVHIVERQVHNARPNSAVWFVTSRSPSVRA
jgi:hypothetical protein